MNVTLYSIDQGTGTETREWGGTLSAFLAENQEQGEVFGATITAELEAFGRSMIGGGAVPLYVICAGWCAHCHENNGEHQKGCTEKSRSEKRRRSDAWLDHLGRRARIAAEAKRTRRGYRRS